MTRALVLKSPGFAGLGDLLLALERALIVAQATGRSLVVDWRDTPYSRDDQNLAEQLFELRGVRQLPPAVLTNASGMVLPVAWQGRLDQPLRQVYASLRTDDWNRAWASTELDAGLAALDSDAAWVVLWDHSAPALQSAALRRLGAGMDTPLRDHLLPHRSLLDAINAYRQKHFCRPMIGLHLRASAEAVRAGKNADLEQVFQRLDRLRLSNPASGLFLASDNVAAIAAIQARYPDVIIRTKWLPPADDPLHLLEHGHSDGFLIATDAFIELFLLGACDWLVHPRLSSFSIVSTRLSEHTPCHVYPIQSTSLTRPSFKMVSTSFSNALKRVKFFYRHLRYPHSCSVCGGSFVAFNPIDPLYQAGLDAAGSELSLSRFETLNVSEYSCPLCGTADRNRLAALALSRIIPGDSGFRLLDIAPSSMLSQHIRNAYLCSYRTADLGMEGVDEMLDVQDMSSFADSSLDGVICSHVLEHVASDGLALAEFWRVLSPGGWALLSVPIYQDITVTLDEGLAPLTPQERCRQFGQSDHVRLYEKFSFIARVEAAGFRVNRMGIDTFGARVFKRFGITENSAIYLCIKINA